VSYVDDLSRELRRFGIRGSLERRIIAEMADHLASDPSADLGPADELARRFADELGASRSRRAAFAAFVALATAGVGYAVVTVLPAAEARVLVRRAGLGLFAGLTTVGAVALVAYEYGAILPAWATTLCYACAAIGAAALITATPAVIASTRIRVNATGDAGDVFADLGALVPARLRGRPWPFARAVAALLFVAVTVAGVAQSDPYDGALRGLTEAVAALAGFAVLGRFLGLRRE